MLTTIHSGRAYRGFIPSNSTSSSVSFSNLEIISIGVTLLSFSTNVVGFSNLVGYFFVLQWGHVFTVFKYFNKDNPLNPLSWISFSNAKMCPHEPQMLLKTINIFLT